MESVLTEGREETSVGLWKGRRRKGKGQEVPQDPLCRYGGTRRGVELQPHFLPLVSIMFRLFGCGVYAQGWREGLAQSLPEGNMPLRHVI